MSGKVIPSNTEGGRIRRTAPVQAANRSVSDDNPESSPDSKSADWSVTKAGWKPSASSPRTPSTSA
jgi:hypothetical protein